jgi:TM2 domain-containing membrane protein YozV
VRVRGGVHLLAVWCGFGIHIICLGRGVRFGQHLEGQRVFLWVHLLPVLLAGHRVITAWFVWVYL